MRQRLCPFPLVETEVHPGHCYLRAKHGHEQSDGNHVKGWSIVSKPFISLFYKFQAFSAYLNRSEMYVIRKICLCGFRSIIDLLRKLRQLIMAQFVWSSIDSRRRMHLFSPFRTMQAFRKLLDQLSSVVLISVRSCLFRLEFHFKALLIKSYVHDCTKRRWT